MLPMIQDASVCLNPVSTICLVLMVFPSFSRLNLLLKNRLRRDLDGVSVEKKEELQHFVRPEDIRDTLLLPHSR